jgi:hypothetical protein
METGSSGSDSGQVIVVDGPDEEQDVVVYQGWVRDCPDLSPIVRAELLARAVAISGNYPARSAVTLSMRYWADQRPRIPRRLLTDLIGSEMPNRSATSFAYVGNDATPNRGALAAHVPFAVHPFDQVQHTIVPVFTLGDRMIAWREALPPLPPRVADASESPESEASEDDVALSQ